MIYILIYSTSLLTLLLVSLVIRFVSINNVEKTQSTYNPNNEAQVSYTKKKKRITYNSDSNNICVYIKSTDPAIYTSSSDESSDEELYIYDLSDEDFSV